MQGTQKECPIVVLPFTQRNKRQEDNILSKNDFHSTAPFHIPFQRLETPVFSCRIDNHVIVIAIQILIGLFQASLVLGPHPIQIASRTMCVILKVICAGVDFGSGTKTSPKLLGQWTFIFAIYKAIIIAHGYVKKS